ncbi:hypothetical protein CWRG_01545 [Chthonomonas calidirosea]|uniref:Uncharacterized protein n=1 Tax=Chthonomonas calidirosea (strain DSM 23976 / ICMP 18418 / T49) TaxID=1303518 RepID=S0EXU6_CHTCT|nr:hypothetical protein [Chthonomonas calidirosea]CCW36327.1 hypothetical protein CCALI_02530 [Chthonomonas calidirosea T49]CEK16589.1 hypothetical protein CP488_01560 [Chthonomonas calidirosea]CEK16599.1 hypothetical protein CWRG_01545 [Chthonomonas calidirosea]CEK17662.1 hypothetical protein CTKA_01561 [Chthonomonas calidirosea]
MDSQRKTVLVIIVVVIAVALAIWSAVRTFGPHGRTIGSLGSLNESKTAPGFGGNSTNSALPKSNALQEKEGGSSTLSGAPAGMGGP